MSSEYALELEDVDEARERGADFMNGGGEGLFFSIRPSSLRNLRSGMGERLIGGWGIVDVEAADISSCSVVAV
jgi:hypothetical protein